MLANGFKRKAEETSRPTGNFNNQCQPTQPQPHQQQPPMPQGQYFSVGPGDYRQQWMPGGWPPRGRVMHGGYFPRRGNQRQYFQRAGCRPMQNFNNFGPGWPPRPNMYPPDKPPDYQWVPNTSVPPPPPPLPQQAQVKNEVSCPKAKKRKRTNTTQGYTTRPWNRQDAERALNLEIEYQKNTSEKSIIIRFPDPELSRESVKRFHPSIESVHFQAPSGSRFCFVQLSDSCNVEKVITELEQIKFGCGTLKAERKVSRGDDATTPEAIDPYTLYVGNLPSVINTSAIKDKFPNAARIDIGYAQKLKFTRYAFVRFAKADDAVEAYRSVANTTIASRSIILRFRRHKGPVGPRGERPEPSTEPKAAAKKDVKKEKVKPEKGIKAEKKTADDDNDDDDDDEEDEDESEEEEEDDDDDDDDDDEDTHNPDEEDDDDDDDDDEEEDDDDEDDEPEDEDEEDDNNLDDDGSDDDCDKDVDDLFEKLGEKVVDINWNGNF